MSSATTPFSFPRDVPVRTDGVVTLRAHGDHDVDAMVEMCTDPQMQRWTAVPQDYHRQNAVDFARDAMRIAWEQKDHRGWAIEAVDPNTGETRFAGNIDVRGTPIADVGFALHPWARGRGLMTRALALAAQWCFQDGGVEIIHWRAQVGNVASLRTAWASGFTLHGTTPGLLHEREQVLDAWTASLRFGDDGRPRTTWWDVPVIEGDRVRLRPFADRDAPRIVEACGDETTRHWLSFLPAPYTEQTARDHVISQAWRAACGDTVTWCVADRESDLLLGSISVLHLSGSDPSAGEIGYWTHPDARGRGVMGEAASLATRHALKPETDGGLGRRRLELLAGGGNAASNAIARRLGFHLVGTKRRAEPLGDGSYDDLNVYDLLA